MTIELTLSTSLLIAHPQLEGEFFARSVIYLVSHNDEGSFGFIINKPSDFSLGDLMGEAVPRGDLPAVQIGGPVGLDQLFFLHPSEANIGVTEPSSATVPICDVSAAAPKEAPAIAMLGYAGWSPGQLEDELKQDVWLAMPANSAMIFDCPVEDRYRAALASLGLQDTPLPPMQGQPQ